MATYSARVFIGLILLCACGCDSTKAYDLSDAPPFDQYHAKIVRTTRPAVLVYSIDHIGGNDIVYAEGTDELKYSKTDQYVNLIVLPPGTPIHILSTWLASEHSGFCGCGMSIDRLYTSVEIPGDSHVLRPDILATFNNASPRDAQVFGFDGTIRPAPWEPIETPEVRKLVAPPGGFYEMRDWNGVMPTFEAKSTIAPTSRPAE